MAAPRHREDQSRGARRAHLVGIAGSGMRSLARVLLGRGWSLTGSDLAPCSPRWLLETRIPVCLGHHAKNVPPGASMVIRSDAIPAENPEILRAGQLGIPILSYFDMLGRMMAGTRGLAVAGTHGKSTTTAMAAHILVQAGLDPTVVCGAAALGQSDGGRAGRGPAVLVEACEYRANFLKLHPRLAIITGIESDHFDCFASLADVEQAFGRFARRIPPEGVLLARHECQATRRVIAGLPCRVETFGLDDRADWMARPIGCDEGRYRFEVRRGGQPIGEILPRVPGLHNVINALAATALASHQGVEPEAIARALGEFSGLHRRLEVVGAWQGVTLVDDYAHHPTEVSAALETIRQMFPGRRLYCAFQPHQVSRTACLLDELAASLHNVDKLWVAEIFRAREPEPTVGEVTAADLAHRVRQLGGRVARMHELGRIGRDVKNHLAPGDVLVTIGAGNIGRMLADEFSIGLREIRAAG
ncbi:MAG: UDP-N-acetylmuramate--L-alanine ligase [Planctomycetia bacterium]|nr:UDP-N-acetylmuramate--L-alanine ligase [Planctomycetia bacterium]